MKQEKFLSYIVARNARVVTGPSATRGKGNDGVGEAARGYLPKIDLQRFATHNPRRFRAALDEETDRLLHSFPKGARDNWGLARKLLNLFLRDCLYTIYLEEVFHLSRAEHLFELPLDSITGTKLCESASPMSRHRWPGIKRLSRELNTQLQAVAQAAADYRDISRVHLDAEWWSAPRSTRQ